MIEFYLILFLISIILIVLINNVIESEKKFKHKRMKIAKQYRAIFDDEKFDDENSYVYARSREERKADSTTHGTSNAASGSASSTTHGTSSAASGSASGSASSSASGRAPAGAAGSGHGSSTSITPVVPKILCNHQFCNEMPKIYNDKKLTDLSVRLLYGYQDNGEQYVILHHNTQNDIYNILYNPNVDKSDSKNCWINTLQSLGSKALMQNSVFNYITNNLSQKNPKVDNKYISLTKKSSYKIHISNNIPYIFIKHNTSPKQPKQYYELINIKTEEDSNGKSISNKYNNYIKPPIIKDLYANFEI